MAKQTEETKKNSPVAPPPSASPSNGAVVKGEIVPTNEAAPVVLTAQQVGKDALANLEKALSGKSDEMFEKPEADFWKPEKPGDTLIGAYLGSEKQGRLIQHAFAVKNSKGDGYKTMRMNGSHLVTRTLQDCRVGRIVKLVFKGQKATSTPTDGGSRRLNDFDIFLSAE